VREGAANRLDPERIAVAGESVGGCMTAALALMANDRGDVRFVQQSMWYPVTEAAMDTESYEQFAEGYFLTAKGWRRSGTPTSPTSNGARSHTPRLSARATSS
jgi:acetyl esterase/lipase